MGKRRESLDLIRAVAIVLVVLLHTIGHYVPVEAMTHNVCQAFGTLGVPLFVILTGYLMADRDYQGEYLTKYVKCNLIPLIVCFEAWNLIWYLLGKITWLLPGGGGLPATASTTLKAALFIGNTGSALWYLPMCIGLYLGLPITSRLLRWAWGQRSNTYLAVLLVGLLYFGILVPTLSGYASDLNIYNPVTPVLSLNIFSVTVWGDSVWMIYLAAGFAIKRGCLDKVPTYKLTICFTLISVLMTISMIETKTLGGGYANLFVCTDGVLLFALLDRLQPWLESPSNKVRLVGQCLSHYSFPIYMIHLWVAGGLSTVLSLAGISQEEIMGLYPPLALVICLLIMIIIISISSFIAKGLSYLPHVRRWLFLWR